MTATTRASSEGTSTSSLTDRVAPPFAVHSTEGLPRQALHRHIPRPFLFAFTRRTWEERGKNGDAEALIFLLACRHLPNLNF